MSTEMVMLIYYWNGNIKYLQLRERYSLRRSTTCSNRNKTVTFLKFIDNLYHVTSYDKQFTRLPVTCWYPMRKEYIALPIIDQGASTYHEGETSYVRANSYNIGPNTFSGGDSNSDGHSETDNEESLLAQTDVFLNKVSQLLGKDLTPRKSHHVLTE